MPTPRRNEHRAANSGRESSHSSGSAGKLVTAAGGNPMTGAHTRVSYIIRCHCRNIKLGNGSNDPKFGHLLLMNSFTSVSSSVKSTLVMIPVLMAF